MSDTAGIMISTSVPFFSAFLICLLYTSEAALEKGDVEAAKDIARNTRGPIASIYYQGLMRIDQGQMIGTTVVLMENFLLISSLS